MLTTLTPVAILSLSTPLVHAQPTPAEAAWVQSRAIALKSVEAGNGFEDLEPFRELFQSVRVVGLGEATHGTREHFQLKHRLVEFLASECGYTIFSIEASSPEAFRVGDYVRTGRGDPARLIGGMYFWTWNTEEVLEMVEWMRDFNERERDAGSGKSIAFTGFDMQEPRLAKRIVSDFIAKHDPDFAPALEEKWTLLDEADGPQEAPFATATGTFPIDAARGKKVTFRGFIKAQGVQDGHAGLWWRVDGPDNVQLAFDNMHDRGPRGTTDWREYSLTLDVPHEAVNINFGCLLTGRGTAWFDSLTIELDGVLYEAEEFDFTFDGPSLKGLHFGSPGYSIARDAGVAHDGALSLKIASNSAPGTPRASDPRPVARAVFDHMLARKDAYVHSGADARDVEWAIHNAEIVHQWASMIATRNRLDVNVRDESMARNVMWLLEQNPGAKVVIWAHNFHIATQPLAQGGYLREQLGDDYLAAGFFAGEGTYYAMPGRDHHGFVHDLAPPPPNSVEALFAAVGHDVFALILRDTHGKAPGSRWLLEPRPTRTIGAMAMKNQFFPRVIGECFDLLFHVQHTSAARQLKTAPGAYDPP